MVDNHAIEALMECYEKGNKYLKKLSLQILCDFVHAS